LRLAATHSSSLPCFSPAHSVGIDRCVLVEQSLPRATAANAIAHPTLPVPTMPSFIFLVSEWIDDKFSAASA
jgi:hypothetical protein